MARILLIKAEGLGRLNYAVTPPLGLLYLAALLRRERGHEIRILDLRVSKDPARSLAKEVGDFLPHLVGLSAITMEAPSLHKIASTVKNLSRNIPVIAGGPHPTSFPEDVLSDQNIDAVVFGEGEQTVLELSDVLLDGGDVKRVNGIGLRKDGAYVRTPARPPIQDLDALPFPAWDLLDIAPYSHVRGMASLGFRRYMALFTSRSCPFHCIYCHNIFGKGFRARSPQNVLEEVKFLMKTYGIREFEILDDIFNFNTKRASEIFSMLPELGASFSFPNGLRTDLLDEDQLQLMKNGGVNYISIAVETASPRLQKLIKKNLKLDKVWNAIEICNRLRIFTRGFFMLGFPTETLEEIKQTISYACSSSLHTAMFFIATPFQGTEMEAMHGKKNSKIQASFRDYDYFAAPFNLSDIDNKELFRLQRNASIRFTLSPKRIAWVLRDYPKKRFLWYHGWKALTGFLQYSWRGN